MLGPVQGTSPLATLVFRRIFGDHTFRVKAVGRCLAKKRPHLITQQGSPSATTTAQYRFSCAHLRCLCSCVPSSCVCSAREGAAHPVGPIQSSHSNQHHVQKNALSVL